jgi:hypothetical protein
MVRKFISTAGEVKFSEERQKFLSYFVINILTSKVSIFQNKIWKFARCSLHRNLVAERIGSNYNSKPGRNFQLSNFQALTAETSVDQAND